MGTPLVKIFNKFLGEIDDKEWLLVDDDIIEELMLDYLESATVDFIQCRKDLSFTPPVKGEIEVSVDALEKEFSFDPIEDERPVTVLNIVGITGQPFLEGEDYTYENKIITFTQVPTENIQVKYSVEGFFEEELSLMEIRILAHAMLLHYLKPKIMTQDSLKQYVSDKDFSKLSGANMLLRLVGLKRNIEKELEVMQGRYAFQDFQGWN